MVQDRVLPPPQKKKKKKYSPCGTNVTKFTDIMR